MLFPGRGALLTEVRPMLSIAGPVLLAELGWLTMGIVDTLMVGPLGPEAIGAVGLGSSIFIAVAIFGMGLLLGLDTLVAQAYGAGDLDECHIWLLQGVYLALIVSLPLTAIVLVGSRRLEDWGLHGPVLELATPY